MTAKRVLKVMELTSREISAKLLLRREGGPACMERVGQAIGRMASNTSSLKGYPTMLDNDMF